MTVDPLWPDLEPYAYAHSSPTRFTDPLGLDVYLCRRALRERDYLPGCPTNLKTPAEHWWFMLTSHSAPCRSIGYGPGGRYGHAGNLGRGYPSDITCELVSRDKAVEDCICELAARVERGWILCGSTWVDNNECHTYNFATHNCQDYTICLLHRCGLESPWIQRQQGWPYNPDVVPFWGKGRN